MYTPLKLKSEIFPAQSVCSYNNLGQDTILWSLDVDGSLVGFLEVGTS